MNYEKKYKDALERAKAMIKVAANQDEAIGFANTIFPELAEPEDEKIRGAIIHFISHTPTISKGVIDKETMIAWLEKQGEQSNNEDESILYRFSFYSYKDEPNILYLAGLYVNDKYRNKGIGTKILKIADEVTTSMKCSSILLKTEIGSNAERLYKTNGYNVFRREGNQVWLEKQGGITELSEEEQNRFAKGVLTRCALSFIDYLDAHKYEGKMCVSNGECEDIENAFHNAMWDRLYRYYCKYIEKQGNDSANINIDTMVSSYEQRLKSQVGIENSHFVNMCLTAFKHGIEEVLKELNLKKLDKHGEQNAIFNADDYNSIDPYFGKPIDKVETKLHEGDWVVQGDKILKIKCVGDTYCCFETVGGYVDDMLVSEIDSQFHLWTIQDAKDGDVIYHKAENGIEYIVMSKGLNKFNNIDSYFRYSSIDGFGIDIPSVLSAKCDSITPATKEQREFLFQKMKEAGYDWDANKKELKLLITNGGDFFESCNCEQNHAQSEDDKDLINQSVCHLQRSK